MDPLRNILTEHWKFSSFRPLQEEIIRSVLQGRDTLALLPTGGGKSLCFQLPALARPGLCLVVSPLVALMKDQVGELRRKNITAFALYSGMNRKAVINTLELASQSNCKFLYVSPERLETETFLEYLPSLPVNLIAVDEAHCVSQWGYDFRPPYLRIAVLREELPGIPVLALTASATPGVQADIIDKLGLIQPHIFRPSFERPLLSYSVFSQVNKIDKIGEILQNVPGSSIVYCRTRRGTEMISGALRERGIEAGYYHAGLTHVQRTERQQAWMMEGLRVIVATNAFGMGIDKAGVRTVIHAEVPDSLESYYQEAGRAGRDGNKAYAVLLFDEDELGYLQSLPEARFPPLEILRSIYQSLMNYLQIPASEGMGRYYPFDLSAFCKAFRLGRSAVLATLKVLEQEGLLTYLEQPYLPARIQFLAGRQTLSAFEADHPALKPAIEMLLRTYEGIVDRPVNVYERQLSGLLKKEPGDVMGEWQRLHEAGIINFTPIQQEPLLYFFRDRVLAENLYIDPSTYRSRKEHYAARIAKMMDYLLLTTECRSRFLAFYFGDEKARDCGICDNCLRRRKNR